MRSSFASIQLFVLLFVFCPECQSESLRSNSHRRGNIINDPSGLQRGLDDLSGDGRHTAEPPDPTIANYTAKPIGKDAPKKVVPAMVKNATTPTTIQGGKVQPKQSGQKAAHPPIESVEKKPAQQAQPKIANTQTKSTPVNNDVPVDPNLTSTVVPSSTSTVSRQKDQPKAQAKKPNPPIPTKAPVGGPSMNPPVTTAPKLVPRHITSAPSVIPDNYNDGNTNMPSPAPIRVETVTDDHVAGEDALPGYEPPSDAASMMHDYSGDEDDLNLLKEEMELAQVEKEAKTAGGLGIMLAMFAMIFTAYQMSENPDGIFASVCRLSITLVGCGFKIVTIPCRNLLGNRYHAGHIPVSTMEYREPYRGNMMEMT